ncbi:MAG: hypothetical protein JWM59_3441 [Verrucomicrobiales bacterium]|nr:hypothetical protein [Verrucomicrobiales bacterium]
MSFVFNFCNSPVIPLIPAPPEPLPGAEPSTSRRCLGKNRSTPFLGLLLAVSQLAPCGRLSAGELQPIDLRSAARFTILAGAAITTTGGGAIQGDVGASPIAGSAIHLTQAQVDGAIYSVDASGPAGARIDPALLLAAKGDLTTAYNDAAGRTPIPSGPFLNPGAGNIGGMSLIPGLYKFPATAIITGADLTLTGAADDVWIFQIASDLQVGSGVKIILKGGAQARNIFWQVGTSAVIETFAVFKGSILADQSIVMKTSSTMEGRALAFTAGVTYNGTGGSLPVPESPVFTDISRTPAGAVTLVLKTSPYFLLTLQTSTRMAPGQWSTVVKATPQVNSWTYTHPATNATGPERFYRAFLSNPE